MLPVQFDRQGGEPARQTLDPNPGRRARTLAENQTRQRITTMKKLYDITLSCRVMLAAENEHRATVDALMYAKDSPHWVRSMYVNDWEQIHTPQKPPDLSP